MALEPSLLTTGPLSQLMISRPSRKPMGFRGSVVKNLPANAGDMDLTPESRRPPGEGNGLPLQYSCLGNPMDPGAWWATLHGVMKSRTRLSTAQSRGALKG